MNETEWLKDLYLQKQIVALCIGCEMQLEVMLYSCSVCHSHHFRNDL